MHPRRRNCSLDPTNAFANLKKFKNDMNINIYNSILQREINGILDKHIIFTDVPNSTSCAVTDQIFIYKYKLDYRCTIYTVEAHAIAVALHLVMTSGKKNIIICSNSESNMKSISSMYPQKLPCVKNPKIL